MYFIFIHIINFDLSLSALPECTLSLSTLPIDICADPHYLNVIHPSLCYLLISISIHSSHLDIPYPHTYGLSSSTYHSYALSAFLLHICTLTPSHNTRALHLSNLFSYSLSSPLVCLLLSDFSLSCISSQSVGFLSHLSILFCIPLLHPLLYSSHPPLLFHIFLIACLPLPVRLAFNPLLFFRLGALFTCETLWLTLFSNLTASTVCLFSHVGLWFFSFLWFLSYWPIILTFSAILLIFCFIFEHLSQGYWLADLPILPPYAPCPFLTLLPFDVLASPSRPLHPH